MSGRRGEHPDPVERYLRRLGRWAPRSTRRELVAEARRHLFDVTQRLERCGWSGQAAQQAALTRFGPAWKVGLAAHRWAEGPLLGRLLRPRVASSRLLRAIRTRLFLPAQVPLRHPPPAARRRPRLGPALRRQCHRTLQGTRHTFRRLTRR